MKIYHKEIIEIIERSSSLTERLAGKFIFNNLKEDEIIKNSRLQEWCQIVAEGDWTIFEQRLNWDGFDLITIQKFLGEVKLTNNYSIPAWADTLEEIILSAFNISYESCLSENVYKENLFLNPDYPLPFEHLFIPFIHLSKKRLIGSVGINHNLLSSDAYTNLERELLTRLTQICGPTLELEFSIFRLKYNQSSLKNVQNTSALRNQYNDFIKDLLTGSLLLFFRQYPVLAKLVATVIDLWLNASQQFILRLATDWDKIQKMFSSGTQLKQVITLKQSLSDYHCDGFSVVSIKFDSGLKLVYKPKNLGLESAYFKLLSWLNQQEEIPLQFKIIKIMDCLTYGWAEFVEDSPCEDMGKIKMYYTNCGATLFILYILGATDMHYENLIACGEFPVVIDLETLMHPKIKEIKNQTNNVDKIAYDRLNESVVSTSFLPYWYYLNPKNNFALDISGLGGFENQESIFKKSNYNWMNSDFMKLSYESIKFNYENNVFSHSLDRLSPLNYVEDIVRGFELMGNFFLKQKSNVLKNDNILRELFKSQKIRMVFRPTSTYASILTKMLHPKFLVNGVERSIQLDILSRAFLGNDSKSNFWNLLKIEKKSLEQLDIPIFNTYSNSASIILDKNESIKNCLKYGFNEVEVKLKNLSQQTVIQESEFIRYSFYGRAISNIHSLSSSFQDDSFEFEQVIPLITRETLVKQAESIGTALQQRAIFSNSGAVTWLANQYNYQANKYHLSPMTLDLYEGYCGVLLFLSGLAKISSNVKYKNLVIGSLNSLCHQLQNKEFENFSYMIKNDELAKLGGVIYSIATMSRLLPNQDILEIAERLTKLIQSTSNYKNQQSEVVVGVAGTIMGLLAFYEVAANQTILDLAILCGNHLLSNRVVTQEGYKTWKTLNGKLLTGFAHGAAGIAYALLRLYKATGEIAFLEAAEEAIAYERSVFIPKQKNWPDFRQSFPKEKPVCMCSWCHGATGIGLARLGGLDILDTPEIRQDIEAAINTTKQQKLTGIDHLCCGNMGRVEFLLTASRKLSRPDLLEDAMQIVSQVVARANQKGYFGYGPILTFHPGFLQGASGIGYQLLRLAHPDQLPSVLLWE